MIARYKLASDFQQASKLIQLKNIKNFCFLVSSLVLYLIFLMNSAIHQEKKSVGWSVWHQKFQSLSILGEMGWKCNFNTAVGA